MDQYRKEKDFINELCGLSDEDHTTALNPGNIYMIMRLYDLTDKYESDDINIITYHDHHIFTMDGIMLVFDNDTIRKNFFAYAKAQLDTNGSNTFKLPDDYIYELLDNDTPRITIYKADRCESQKISSEYKSSIECFELIKAYPGSFEIGDRIWPSWTEIPMYLGWSEYWKPIFKKV